MKTTINTIEHELIQKEYKAITDRMNKFYNDMLSLPKDELRQASIKEQFDDIKSKLGFLSKDNYALDISLNFEHKDDWAYAWYTHAMEQITFNTKYDYNEQSTIVHELTHHICKKYNIDKDNKGSHHLEFAIIYGVLYNEVNTNNSGYFFRSYDIQDDIAYEKLHINPKKWDDMIKRYEYDNIYELVQFAKIKASSYRELCSN